MANASYTIDVVVFDVRDPDKTTAWAFVTALGDCPYMVQGWHSKDFPADVPTQEIYNLMGQGDSPMMWPNSSAPSFEDLK